MSKYPTMTQLKNIRREKRKCAHCGRKITGYGYFYVLTIARGKHLCKECEAEGESHEKN